MRFLPLLIPVLLAACSPSTKLTESEEYYAGRAVASEFLTLNKIHPDMDLQRYVNLVGISLAFSSDRPEVFNGWTFGVIQSETINAVAAPSGFIFITTGLLKNLKNEDELAGVLAHEVAHVCQRHPELAVQAKVSASKGSSFFKGLVSIAGAVANVATEGEYGKELTELTNLLNNVSDYVSGELWEKGYERDQEYEADLGGVDILANPDAGYNPLAFVDVLARMAELGKRGPGAIGGFFNPSTHPDPMKRVDHVRDYIREKGYTGSTNPERTKRFLQHTASLSQ